MSAVTLIRSADRIVTNAVTVDKIAPKRKRRGKPQWPTTGEWPTPAPLRPVQWGKPDPALGALVCRNLEHTMPPEVLWTWRARKAHIPGIVGWLVLAGIIAATVAGFRV